MTFVSGPPDEKSKAVHIDGDPKNDRLDNLKWGTQAEVVASARSAGASNAPRLSDQQKIDIRIKYWEHKASSVKLAKEYNVSTHTIHRVIR